MEESKKEEKKRHEEGDCPLGKQGKEEEEDEDDLVFWDPDLFLNQSYATRTFTFGEFSVDILLSNAASTDYDLTGQVLWPAASYLSEYIVTHQNMFHDKCPTQRKGLCGLLAHKLSQRCILTDHNDHVLELLQKNVDNHKAKEGQGRVLMVQKLEWGEGLEEFKANVPDLGQGFDVIIGSDVVYWPECIEPLLRTVEALLSPSADSVFILSYMSRAKNADALLHRLLEQYAFSTTVIRHENDVFVVEIRRERKTKE
ncbi:Methyltransferase-like protein 21A, variant 2 [Balamuthia mandrillaris]